MLAAIEKATRKKIDQLELPSTETVNNQRIARFKQTISDTLAAGELGFMEGLIEQYQQEHDVPAAKCLTHEEVLGQAQYEATGTIDHIEHPVMGNMRRVKPPAQFGGARLEPASDSPAHGEHTLHVLKELGRTDGDIEALRDAGIIANEAGS